MQFQHSAAAYRQKQWTYKPNYHEKVANRSQSGENGISREYNRKASHLNRQFDVRNQRNERDSEEKGRRNEEVRKGVQFPHAKIRYSWKLNEGGKGIKENVADENLLPPREPNRSNQGHCIIQNKKADSSPKCKKLGLKIPFPAFWQRRKQRKHSRPQYSQSKLA